jgi:hypothetical protein
MMAKLSGGNSNLDASSNGLPSRRDAASTTIRLATASPTRQQVRAFL